MTSLYDLSECFRRVHKTSHGANHSDFAENSEGAESKTTGTRATARTFVNDFGGLRRQPVVQYPILTLMATLSGKAESGSGVW
jgi:hypothetical protein